MPCQPTGCQSLDVKKFLKCCHQDMCSLRRCRDPLSVYKAFKVTGMHESSVRAGDINKSGVSDLCTKILHDFRART